MLPGWSASFAQKEISPACFNTVSAFTISWKQNRPDYRMENERLSAKEVTKAKLESSRALYDPERKKILM